MARMVCPKCEEEFVVSAISYETPNGRLLSPYGKAWPEDKVRCWVMCPNCGHEISISMGEFQDIAMESGTEVS